MASPGQLVQVMADALSLPKTTPLVHDRHLVVAGLRSKHGRGRGAAKVTPGDAARLLVAILGSATLEDSVETVERYAATRVAASENGGGLPYARLGIAELERLSKDHSLVDAVEAVIASAAAGSLAEMMDRWREGTRATRAMVAPLIGVSVLVVGTLGGLRIAGLDGGRTAAVCYALPSATSRKGGKRPPGRELDAWAAAARASRGDSDYERSGRVSERTILRLADLLAPAEQEGV
jgi:hypothetical protein